MQEDLESLIRRHVILGRPSPQGFCQVKCAKCNDYKTRAGFKFEASNVIYSCFNCSTKAVFESTAHKVSKTMSEVLLAFGIPESEIKKCAVSNFFKPQSDKLDQNTDSKKKTVVELPLREVQLPHVSFDISTDESAWCEVAREYLAGRGFDKPTAKQFFVTENSSYEGRLLIPYYFRGNIIYWQGRSMDDSISPRYKNPIVEKANIFYNMDEIYRYTDEPLFVFEGPLDAHSVGRNGVALAGSDLTEFKEQALIKAAGHRDVIFVIDKNLNGNKLGQKVIQKQHNRLKLTCFPDNIEDANDALLKLGSLWMATYLVSSAVTGLRAELLLELSCAKEAPQKVTREHRKTESSTELLDQLTRAFHKSSPDPQG